MNASDPAKILKKYRLKGSDEEENDSSSSESDYWNERET
jgi:hypothetical protein